jgi:hypothetical protein
MLSPCDCKGPATWVIHSLEFSTGVDCIQFVLPFPITPLAVPATIPATVISVPIILMLLLRSRYCCCGLCYCCCFLVNDSHLARKLAHLNCLPKLANLSPLHIPTSVPVPSCPSVKYAVLKHAGKLAACGSHRPHDTGKGDVDL